MFALLWHTIIIVAVLHMLLLLYIDRGLYVRA